MSKNNMGRMPARDILRGSIPQRQTHGLAAHNMVLSPQVQPMISQAKRHGRGGHHHTCSADPRVQLRSTVCFRGKGSLCFSSFTLSIQDRPPEDEEHWHSPAQKGASVSAQKRSHPSHSKQPSVLVGLSCTEHTEFDLQVNPSETFKSRCSTWTPAFLFLSFRHYITELNEGLSTAAQPTSVPCEQNTGASPSG